MFVVVANLVHYKSSNNGYKLLALIYWGSKSPKNRRLSFTKNPRTVCRKNVSTVSTCKTSPTELKWNQWTLRFFWPLLSLEKTFKCVLARLWLLASAFLSLQLRLTKKLINLAALMCNYRYSKIGALSTNQNYEGDFGYNYHRSHWVIIILDTLACGERTLSSG